MSLLPERQRWSERALSPLDEAARGGSIEIHLQAALGVSSISTREGGDAPRNQRTTTVYLGFEARVPAGAVLARTLWLQGHPAQAVERACHAVHDIACVDHPLTPAITHSPA